LAGLGEITSRRNDIGFMDIKGVLGTSEQSVSTGLFVMLEICHQSGRTVFVFMVLGTSDRSDSTGYFVAMLVVLVLYLL